MHEVIEAIATCAVVELGLRAVGHGHRDLAARPAVGAGHRGGRVRRLAGRLGAVVLVVGGRVARRERLLARLVHVVVGAVVDVVAQGRPEGGLGVGERDPVLRPLRAGDAGHHRGQVELEVLGEHRLRGRVVPQALLLGVGLDEGDLRVAAAGEPQVVAGDVVDGEHRRGRAELGAHVADRGAVGQRHGADTLAVELDELADDTVLAQHLGDREDDVGGGGAGGDLAAQLEADHARDEHRHRLAEHRGLGLDAADAPAEDAEAVDHGGVRVGADAGVGVGDAAALEHHAGQVLDVDLVHDAGARGDDLEVVERGLAPAQELVALTVALVLELDVLLERVGAAEDVGDDRVVDDHLGRRERVDPGRVAAELGRRPRAWWRGRRCRARR